MAPARDANSRLGASAYWCGLLGFPFWLLSYAWIPFRLMGERDSETVWSVVVISEICAMLLGLIGIGVGFVAGRRARIGSLEQRLARRGLAYGLILWAFIIGFNILGLVFLS